jgi:DMSO/TMAO reductase YedYZ molybdopterin-dependent catalytic subunit
MTPAQHFLSEHQRLTRRFFLQSGVALAAGSAFTAHAADPPAELGPVLEKLESYFTTQAKFGDVSRGQPLPHSLPDAKKAQVGLTRDTWKLDIVSDPEHPASLGRQYTRKDNTALDFAALLKLGEQHVVRFAKIMTCLNIGCPLGMGIWEGVPLRELVWLTQPKENLRRVFYYGYHNDDPKQMFRSSLPIGRVLEDSDGLPPVIVCWKLNGEWLSPKRGGPVRIVVPEHYGYKSVKWLTHLVLSNLYHANDTYGTQNNDVDSPMKTFAAMLHVPASVKANTPIPITGYAQSGISGLAKVQVWVSSANQVWPGDDPYFTRAPWTDAIVLPPPKQWGGDLPGGLIPQHTLGFDADGQPKRWPMRLAKAHWAVLLPGLPAGEYTLRCRTIDGKGAAQPMPRPFRKSGRCDIEAVRLRVETRTLGFRPISRSVAIQNL